MNRVRIAGRALQLGLTLLPLALPPAAQAANYGIVSDTHWTVSDASMNFLGTAQTVCLNAASPSSCPVGATKYGYQLPGWAASIQGATWIWAPNITGTSSGAANAAFTFQMPFYLCGTPRGGTISVAADNFAQVFLNGASTPIATSTSHSTVSTVTVPASALNQGLNLITITASNDANPSSCTSGQYQCNPAGVIFGASFQDSLAQLPTCTDGGRTFSVGEFEALSCPPGEMGSRSRPCICIGSLGVWGSPSNSCIPPPKTCTGANGAIFQAGATETLSCPPGQLGSHSHTCQSDGSWGSATSTCTPPTCTGSNGTIFQVGSTETFPCPLGQTGSQSHICQSSGSWGPATSTCLPEVGVGEICGGSDKVPAQTATCPGGTDCKSKRERVCSGWWIFSRCDYIQSVDWFCLP